MTADQCTVSSFVSPPSPQALELYSTLTIRHGVILLGESGTGKSEVIRVLRKALSTAGGAVVQQTVFPKALTQGVLYGSGSLCIAAAFLTLE